MVELCVIAAKATQYFKIIFMPAVQYFWYPSELQRIAIPAKQRLSRANNCLEDFGY